MLVDQRQAVAWKRIADGNPRLVSAPGNIDKPLHHRRLGGGINQLDCCLRREPAAQQIDVAPQRGVSTDPNQSKGIAQPLPTLRDYRPQQRRKREQDGDGLVADDIQNLSRAGELRIDEVNAGAREQRGYGVAHADYGAQRGQGQKPIRGVDMRGVYGLGDALQKIPLAIDDALRSAGTPGGKHHAGGLVHAEIGGTPALPRGFRRTGQMDEVRRYWRDGLDASSDILSSDDQGWPRIVQHLAQPVARVARIQGDKGASRRQASQHGERKHRTSRQYNTDQVSRFGFGRDGFGQSGETIPQFRKRERCV